MRVYCRKHARLLHYNERSHLNASIRFICVFLIRRIPSALEMEVTRLLALVVNREPFINSVNNAQGRGLDVGLTNHVIAFHAFVEGFNDHVVADILDIDVESVVPLWVLSFLYMSLEYIHPVHDLDVGIHFRKGRSVSGKASLYDFKAKGSLSCHMTLTFNFFNFIIIIYL